MEWKGRQKLRSPSSVYRMATCLLLLLKEHSTHFWRVDSTIQSNRKICLFIWNLHLKWGSNHFLQPRKHSSWETPQPEELLTLKTFCPLYIFNIELNVFFTISKVECYQVITETESAVTHKGAAQPQIIIQMQTPHIFHLDWFSNFLFYFLGFFYTVPQFPWTQPSACPCLPNAVVKGIHHYGQHLLDAFLLPLPNIKIIANWSVRITVVWTGS